MSADIHMKYVECGVFRLTCSRIQKKGIGSFLADYLYDNCSVTCMTVCVRLKNGCRVFEYCKRACTILHISSAYNGRQTA